MASRSRARRHTGASAARGLLGRSIAGFLLILVAVSSLALAQSTQLGNRYLREQAAVIVTEQAEAIGIRLAAESAAIDQLVAATASRLDPDSPAAEAALVELLWTARRWDPTVTFAALVEPRSGRIIVQAGDAHIAHPGPMHDLVTTTATGPLRAAPLADGGYALVTLTPIDPSVPAGDSALVVLGHRLDVARAEALRAASDARTVEFVVDGDLVATTHIGSTRSPVGDTDLIEVAQWRDDGTLVTYIPVVSAATLDNAVMVGLVIDDPLAGLARGLARARAIGVTIVIGLGALLAFALVRVVTRPVRELTATAQAITEGALDRPFVAGSRRDEIGTLAEVLESMRRGLGRQLSVIRQQADALREAASRTVEARDRERRRVAQDLHDGIQQRLVVLRMQVGSLTATARSDPSLQQAATQLATSIDHILDELRATTQALFPPILRDRGLGPALFSLAGRTRARLEVSLDPDPFPRLPAEVEANAYFLVTEAVTNALKHAHSSHIRISATMDDNRLEVAVSDDGTGFDPETGPRGGLVHLHDRARAVGGELRVRSAPGAGTRVHARIPLGTAGDGAWRALEEEQDRGDPSVEVEFFGDAELSEDRVGMLFDRTRTDR